VTNSAKFIDAFATTERVLRRLTGSDRHTPFYQLVDVAAAKAPGVRRYRDDLKEFADLRNAIVHARSDGHAIAEPHERVVRELQRLASMLDAPPQVLPLFQKAVFTIQLSDRISEVLKLFWPKNFSQAPVLSGGKLVGVLTSNTVSRWLATRAGDELVDLSEYSVSDALQRTEHKDNWCMVSRTTPLIDVIDSFDSAEASGRRLDAVLVSQSGKPTEGLLGIITIHDMPKVLRAVSIKRN
jgi:predicted transcriptional regulator